MKKGIIIIICVLQSSLAFSNQYTQIDDLSFFAMDKINEVINPYNIDVELMEAGVFHNTNQYRKSRNLNPLKYQANLQMSATIHSSQMYQHDFFDHKNKYNNHYKNLDDRAEASGYSNYSELAENIYYGYIDLDAAMTYAEIIAIITKDFIASKDHNETLLTPTLEEFGCGVVFENTIQYGYIQFYLTESFGTLF